MEDKPAFKKNVTSHYRSPIRVEKVERAGMTILRPDVCSNVGVNCVQSGSDNNPTVRWFVVALEAFAINGLAHTDLHDRNC